MKNARRAACFFFAASKSACLFYAKSRSVILFEKRIDFSMVL